MIWNVPNGWCRNASKSAASRSRSPMCLCRCRTAPPLKAKSSAKRICGSSLAGRIPAVSNTSRCCRWMKWSMAKSRSLGPGFEDVPDKGSMDLGIVVEVAGRQMQADFEPVLERQIHYFVNGASGIQHIGQRDIAWIRISNAARERL